MSWIVTKYLVTAAVVVMVSEFAKRSDKLGGLVARTFREGVLLAVNHDGDSDSTGSITGNLLGALYCVKSIPQKWLEPLELREVIAELAGDLYAFKDWDIGEYSSNRELNERIWRKYPGG